MTAKRIPTRPPPPIHINRADGNGNFHSRAEEFLLLVADEPERRGGVSWSEIDVVFLELPAERAP